MSVLQVPRFRVPKRLIFWMQDNGVRDRVPSAEGLFFDKKISVSVRAYSLVNYAKQIRVRLPAEMEAVIAEVPASCIEYAIHLRSRGFHVPAEIVDVCGSNPSLVVRMAGILNRRIVHMEHLIVDPEHYVEYCLGLGQRVPDMEDRILFSGSFPLRERAWAAFKMVQKRIKNGFGQPDAEILKDERIKGLIRSDPEVVLSFMDLLGKRSARLPVEYHAALAGDGFRLYKLAEHLRSRLPDELERTWTDARGELVKYAVKWVRGPLPDHLEQVLIGDTKAVFDYAFQVIRGFASPRLSDPLHNFMLLNSDAEVCKYMDECKRVAGNQSERSV